MNMFLIMLSIVAAGGPAQKAAPPLSEAQATRLRTLVQETEKRAKELKAKLQERQDELTELYTKFELDLKKVSKLQKEIVTLQQELLENYHHMQVELRSIVGQERFFILQKRLAHILGVNGPKKQIPKKSNE